MPFSLAPRNFDCWQEKPNFAILLRLMKVTFEETYRKIEPYIHDKDPYFGPAQKALYLFFCDWIKGLSQQIKTLDSESCGTSHFLEFKERILKTLNDLRAAHRIQHVDSNDVAGKMLALKIYTDTLMAIPICWKTKLIATASKL